MWGSLHVAQLAIITSCVKGTDLDGAYAKMTACPANAIEPVKQLVRRTQGYIAQKCWADGVAEALAFYGNGARSEKLRLKSGGQIGLMRPA
jgi:hypothetical protein